MGLIGCGLIPHLELLRRPDLYGRPVVVAAWMEEAVAVSPEAAAFGIRPGTGFRQVRQLCPQAEILPPDPEHAERLRQALSAALYDLAPTVEVRLDGCAFIDLEGSVKPGLALRELRSRLRQASGTEPRLGLAPGPFSARLAATQARPGRLLKVEDAPTFLSPLPIASLGLESELRERLDLLGLRTLGTLAALGPSQLASQLGPVGRRVAELARGQEPDRLQPWQPPRLMSGRRQFEPPVEDREALLFVARAICDELALELGIRGAGAKRMRIRLELETRDAETRESLVRHPLSSSAELFGLAGSWLREWQPAEPVTGLAIEIPELEAAGRRQLRLWVGGDGSREEVIAALERLQERYGDPVAVKPLPALTSSLIPTQRFNWVPLGSK